MADQEDTLELYERWKSERLALASSLSKLKQKSFSVAATRERIPQPLFWSVFHCEIKEARRRKARHRKMAKSIFGSS